MTESELRATKVIASGVENGINAAVKYTLWVVLALVTVMVFGLSVVSKWQPTDSTDFSTSDRSGLKLHTDAMTGCQYLSTSGGGITPRLDRNGHQVCQQPTMPVTAKDKE